MMRIDKCWLRTAEKNPVPRGYGLAYIEYDIATEVYHPIPINYVIRYGRTFYFGFLRVFYWVGLIDTARYEVFRWRDFFRIKTH